MGAKPLYLIATHNQPLLIQLDGPSLRVIQSGRSDGRYPLPQISRILSSGSVQWESHALYAAMERGITITFTTPRKGRKGVLMPDALRESDSNQQLEELLEQLNGWIHLENWIASTERQAILMVQQRLPYNFHDLRPERVQQQLAGEVEKVLPQKTIHQIRKALQGYSSALVAQQMVEAGIENQTLRSLHFNLPNEDINQMFTEIIGWDLEIVLYQAASGIRRRFGEQATLQQRAVTQRLLRTFHQRQPRVEKLIRHTIERYRNWLGRTVRSPIDP